MRSRPKLTSFAVAAALALCAGQAVAVAERSDYAARQARGDVMAAAQTPQEIFVTDAELARDDGAGRAGQRVTGFRTKDNPLHCVASLNKPREGVRVRFVWTAVDAGGERDRVLADAEYVTRAGESRADGVASLPREWPRGRYRVQVFLNGRVVKSLDFNVS
ncbi:MAG TPA: hypothetical protein VER32_00345 [Pyrinomonadaceae bacterium]|nr:hypothetical protein [Pyrinomonadaceae bacterium]